MLIFTELDRYHMDFSILYKVLWQPNEVFTRFKNKARLEPFILIFVITLFSSIHAQYRVLGVLQALLLSMILPAIGATIAFLVTHAILKGSITYFKLFSAFILCDLPYYIEGLLIKTVGLPSLGVGSLISGIRPYHPFIFGILAVFTPFFLWMIYLWWSAIDQLVDLQRKQRILIVSCLVLFNLLLSGFWSQLQHIGQN